MNLKMVPVEEQLKREPGESGKKGMPSRNRIMIWLKVLKRVPHH